jgi:protoheme IX farnesyltransferase
LGGDISDCGVDLQCDRAERCVLIWRRDELASEADNFKVERAFFKFSLLYLFVHFLAILAEALLAPYGLGGWS